LFSLPHHPPMGWVKEWLCLPLNQCRP